MSSRQIHQPPNSEIRYKWPEVDVRHAMEPNSRKKHHVNSDVASVITESFAVKELPGES
jgi:hypothetical protein